MTFIIQNLNSFFQFYVNLFFTEHPFAYSWALLLILKIQGWLGQVQISLFAIIPELSEITVKGKKCLK